MLDPEEAIVSEGLRQLVYPVKDNKIERRVIHIGQRQDGKVEVLEGLRPGESIVVLGVQRVARRRRSDRAASGFAPGAAGRSRGAPANQPSRSSLNVPQRRSAAPSAGRASDSSVAAFLRSPLNR